MPSTQKSDRQQDKPPPIINLSSLWYQVGRLYQGVRLATSGEASLRLPPAFVRWNNWLQTSYSHLAGRLTLLQGVILAPVLALPLILVFSADFAPETEMLYHMGVARSYSAGDFLYSGLPWLPYSHLADTPFAQTSLLQHLLLAPLHWFFAPTEAALIAAALTGTALLASIFAVLRLWGVVGAFWWGLAGWLMSPFLLQYSLSLDSSAVLLPIAVWALDAWVRQRPRQLVVMSWLAVWASTASAPLLLFAGLCFSFSTLLLQRRWQHWPVLAPVLGILGGLLVHPYFPAHLVQAWFELHSLYSPDLYAVAWPSDFPTPVFTPGVWLPEVRQSLFSDLLIKQGGGLLALLPVLLVAVLVRTDSVQFAGLLLIIAFLAGTVTLSSGFLLPLLLVALVLGPLMLHRFAGGGSWVALAAILWLAFWVPQSVATRNLIAEETRTQRAGAPARQTQPLSHWQGLVAAVREHANTLAREQGGEGEQEVVSNSVLLVPWQLFPQFMYYSPDNRYVAGLDIALLDLNSAAFKSYYLTYAGKLADPDAAIAKHYDGARLLLLAANQQEALEKVASRGEAFAELPLPAQWQQDWHLFSRQLPQPAPKPEASVPEPEASLQVPEASLPVPEASVQVPEASLPVPEASASAPEESVPEPEANVQVPEADVSVPETDAP